MWVGGYSDPVPASEEEQRLVEQVKSEVEEKHGKKYEVFVATLCRTQLVNGTYYFIKVHVGGEEYIHLCIYKSFACFGGNVCLSGVQVGKTKEDEIDFR